jgi:hypothetical protein
MDVKGAYLNEILQETIYMKAVKMVPTMFANYSRQYMVLIKLDMSGTNYSMSNSANMAIIDYILIPASTSNGMAMSVHLWPYGLMI